MPDIIPNMIDVSAEFSVPISTFKFNSSKIIFKFFKRSNTFTSNAGLFGKIYFPRLVIPISTVLFALINFGVIFVVSLVTAIYYTITQQNVMLSGWILIIPILVLQTAMLGLGVGILISSLTTKYRDLMVLVSFGIQLWMYATPVVYTIDELPEMLKKIIIFNPMTSIVNNFRFALMGCGEMMWSPWLISWIITLIFLGAGVLLFNKVEKTFMDTV